MCNVIKNVCTSRTFVFITFVACTVGFHIISFPEVNDNIFYPHTLGFYFNLCGFILTKLMFVQCVIIMKIHLSVPCKNYARM